MAGRPIAPYEVQFTQGRPGGSLALDQNLLAIKKVLGHLTLTVNTISETVVIGPGGSPSGGGVTYDFGDSVYIANNAGGAETWCAERMCVWSDATPGTCFLSLAALALSTAGTGTIRIRRGGTTNQPNGFLLATIHVLAAGFSLLTYGPTGVPNPGDSELIKITGQPSAAGQQVKIRSVKLSVR